jgi:hypothetical protein
MFHYFDDSTAFYARDNYQLIKTSEDIELNLDGDTTSFVISLDYGVKYDGEDLKDQYVLTTCYNSTLSGGGKKVIIVAPTRTKRSEQIIEVPCSGAYQYIDGCTDSLLVPPIFKGEDCLNALYFPPDIEQTMHTHPSIRIGVVLEGNGICYWEKDGIVREDRLFSGGCFYLGAEVKHCFHTSDNPMTIVAYHPDSDVGMTNDCHPMLNRTVIDGTPANILREYGRA